VLSFAYLTIRLFAIYFVFNSLFSLIQLSLTWPMLSEQTGSFSAALPLLFAVLVVALGLVLWFAAGPIAQLALPPGQGSTSEFQPHAEDWTRLVVVIFGLYLVITALPSIASLLVRSAQQSSIMSETSMRDVITGDQSNWSQLAYSGTRLLLGLIMLIGRTGIVRFTTFLKNFGLGGSAP